MTETVHIENAVLGGGEAGKYLAWDLARQGRPVVVIERGLIGGSCPNVACLPSKNLIRSAKVASLVGNAASYGIRIDGSTPRPSHRAGRRLRRNRVRAGGPRLRQPGDGPRRAVATCR